MGEHTNDVVVYPISMGFFWVFLECLPEKNTSSLSTNMGPSAHPLGQLIGTSTFKARWSSVFPVFGLYVPGQSVAVDFQAEVPK